MNFRLLRESGLGLRHTGHPGKIQLHHIWSCPIIVWKKNAPILKICPNYFTSLLCDSSMEGEGREMGKMGVANEHSK
jgi:hypothetical protein